MIDLRAITASDVPCVIDLLHEMLRGTKFAMPTKEKVSAIAASDHWFSVGAFSGDRMVGFMAGQCSETFLNNEINGYEKGLFVLPEFRKAGVARKLIERFEAWSRDRGAVNCWMGQSVNQDREGTLRFFESLGYECQGFITCKKL